MKTLNFEEMEMIEGGSPWGNLACGIAGANLDAGVYSGETHAIWFIWYQTYCVPAV